MSRTALATLGLAALAAGAAVLAGLKFSAVQRGNATLLELERRRAETSAQLAAVEARRDGDAKKAQAVVADNAALKTALLRAQQAQAAKAVQAATPMTRAALDERFRRAQRLARTGDPAEALAELRWCWNEGMKLANSAAAPLWRSGVASALGELAKRYPPALADLRERRDVLRDRVLAGPGGVDSVAELAAVLRALKEQAAILDVFDAVPSGDKRRSALSIYGFDQLLEARRYADAMQGHSYGVMVSGFEVTANNPIPPNTPNADRLQESRRSFVVSSTVKNIEALAGSGAVGHARQLADKLLAYDPSAATRELIQQRATRAGQPDLLTAPPKP